MANDKIGTKPVNFTHDLKVYVRPSSIWRDRPKYGLIKVGYNIVC